MIRAEACDLDVAAPSVAVVAALRTVPRHRFLERFYSPSRDPLRGERSLTEYLVDQASPDEAVLDMVYSDQALITRVDEEGRPTSSTSQPALVAAMLELLEARPGTRVLEIGAGTGYNAALLAELVEDPRLVTTVDIQSDVVEQTRRLLADSGYGDVRVLCRDGVDGVPEHAPFDRVVATVGCPDISWRWVEQLAPGGMMLIPLQHGGPGVTPLARLHANSSGDGIPSHWSFRT